MTETNDMIGDLVNDLRPVKPVRPAAVRMAAWAGAAVVGLAIFLTLITARRDLDAVRQSGRLLTDFSTVVLIAVTASWGALRTSVPGEERPWVHKFLPVALLAFWFFFSAVQVLADVVHTGIEALVPDPHIACALLVAAAGLLLTVPIGLLIRRAAPVDPRWCGALTALAASSTAMIGIEAICVYERPIHFGLYHVLPVVVFTTLGAWLGPRVFPFDAKR